MTSTVRSHGSDLSPTTEMYLKAIVGLFAGDAPVSTSAVAHELSVSAASASAMLKRLDADGYLTHDGRHGVVPTAEGHRVGALTIRRQRLAERLLVDHLGVPWELAASESCRLEHAISPLVEPYLARFVGNPVTCPHGHPIPNADGSLWQHEGTVELSEIPLDAATTVIEVRHDMPELLKFLAEIGLRPGAVVLAESRDRLAGLITLEVEGTRRSVSLQLAQAILVGIPPDAPRGAESA